MTDDFPSAGLPIGIPGIPDCRHRCGGEGAQSKLSGIRLTNQFIFNLPSDYINNLAIHTENTKKEIIRSVHRPRERDQKANFAVVIRILLQPFHQCTIAVFGGAAFDEVILRQRTEESTLRDLNSEFLVRALFTRLANDTRRPGRRSPFVFVCLSTLNAFSSTKFVVACVVPQGSNLDPVLFSVFINDLSDIITRTFLQKI